VPKNDLAADSIAELTALVRAGAVTPVEGIGIA
jgi:hypothetical protein